MAHLRIVQVGHRIYRGMEKRVSNSDIAAVFYEIADILDLKNDNVFKIRAYRRAAQLIEGFEKPLSEVEDLEALPGIGKELADKIRTLLRGQKLETLEKLRREVEPGLLQLMRIRGMGPKRVRTLNEKLGVKDLDSFRRALDSGEILELEGFGEKLVADLKKGLSEFQEYSKRTRLDVAKAQAEELASYLRGAKGVQNVEIAGSLRRRLETIGDIDILVAGKDPSAVMAKFVSYPKVREVLSKGDTKSSIVLESGIQADVRFFEEDSFGAGLQYFTGSKSHNIALRTLAKHQGLKISEYGVFRGEERIAGRSEDEIYKLFGLSYIEPELREDRGEIQAAKDGKLPKLIELKDVKGDLQAHSDWTDGRNSIEEMALRAKEMGYEYLALTDHSKSQHQAGGLDEKELKKEFAEIERLNQKLKGIKILKGIELDILKDGSLDLDEGILKEADLVLGSVHANFNLSKDEQTKRLIKALKTGLIHILSHPTCRLIGEREPIQIEWSELIPVLREKRIAVEINASPHRLDANGELAKYLKEQGVIFSLGTDAHTVSGLKDMEYGVFMARRGWLEAKDVLNCKTLNQLEKWLKLRRET